MQTLIDAATSAKRSPARALGRYAAVSAAGKLARSAHTRTSPAADARDYALILVLGDMGPEEARSLEVASIKTKHIDGSRPWLRVKGKGAKLRELPIPTEVVDALLAWERARPPELTDDPLLFPGSI